MNTIRRPRKRPRDKSVSFRTLWWVLVREAYIAALDLSPYGYRVAYAWRAHVARARSHFVRRALEDHLERHPDRRIIR